MVFATQIIFYSLFFSARVHSDAHVSWKLQSPKIYLFALVTLLITLSGYLINDYFDKETDKVNDKVKLPSNQLLLLYFSTILIGFCLALGLATSLGQPLLSTIYLASVALLYLYSASWKKKVLIGNVVVSAFTAGVPLILLYTEWDVLKSITQDHSDSRVSSILYFGAFTFLISIVREIIKDIEDVNGDIEAGYKTLPIVQGVDRAKTLATFYTLALFLVLGFWQYYGLENSSSLVIHLCIVLLLYFPLLYLLVKLSSKNPNWSALSKLCKLVMLAGLVILIIIRCYYN